MADQGPVSDLCNVYELVRECYFDTVPPRRMTSQIGRASVVAALQLVAA